MVKIYKINQGIHKSLDRYLLDNEFSALKKDFRGVNNQWKKDDLLVTIGGDVVFITSNILSAVNIKEEYSSPQFKSLDELKLIIDKY